jgi:hypothetical protein
MRILHFIAMRRARSTYLDRSAGSASLEANSKRWQIRAKPIVLPSFLRFLFISNTSRFAYINLKVFIFSRIPRKTMFKLFSRFFRKTESLSLAELQDWLASERKRDRDSVEKQVKAGLDELDGLISAARDSCDRLQDAGLVNKNVPVRAEQIMLGNRDAFLRRTRDFLRRLEAAPVEIDAVAGYLKDAREWMLDLARENRKGHAVLMEFVGDETRGVAKSLKAIEDCMASIDSAIHNEHGVRLGKISKIIDDHGAAGKARTAALSRLFDSAAELHRVEEQADGLRSQMEDLKDSPQFRDYKGLMSVRSRILERSQAAEYAINSRFSTVLPALKHHLSRKDALTLISQYQANPASAILEDSGLHISPLLAEFRTALESMNVNEKRRERFILALDGLSFDALKALRSEYDTSRNDMRKNDEGMRQSVVLQNYQELEYRLEHLRRKSDQIEDGIHEGYAYVVESPVLPTELINEELKSFGLTLSASR